MNKTICFDMDGTIADLYGVENWLEKIEAEDPSPYREAKPLYEMDVLREVLIALIDEGWEIRVISWLSKNASSNFNKAVRFAKREWLEKYNFPADKVHLIAYGTTKANAVRKMCNPAILIDDNEKIRQGWHLGKTIDPKEGNLIEHLCALLD